MKKRLGFVSNSSSSSFIITNEVRELLKHKNKMCLCSKDVSIKRSKQKIASEIEDAICNWDSKENSEKKKTSEEVLSTIITEGIQYKNDRKNLDPLIIRNAINELREQDQFLLSFVLSQETSSTANDYPWDLSNELSQKIAKKILKNNEFIILEAGNSDNLDCDFECYILPTLVKQYPDIFVGIANYH